MATSPQINLINTLLADRAVPESLAVEAQALVGLGVSREWRDGSQMIERLKGCPFPSRAPRQQAEVKVTEPGVYRHDGEVYIVKPTRETAKLDPSERKLYAKKLVETGATERLAENGEVIIGVEFEYARGAIYKLSPEDRMPFEDAKALTIRYGKCIVCGRSLKAAKSVEAGIGPVCRGYFPDAAAKAEPVEDELPISEHPVFASFSDEAKAGLDRLHAAA